ncbi:MAG TPA: 4-alpha-glucanotransferase [Terriglobia bacterium]|nr:4-alpha-glucanotransferase [Terriglobia bacterium]
MKSPPSGPLAALHRLAAAYGVQTSYRDFFRQTQLAHPESLLAVLRALGAPVHRLEDAPQALREDRVRRRAVGAEAVAVAWDGILPGIRLRMDAAKATGPARCRIVFESGRIKEWDANLAQCRTTESALVAGRRQLTKRLPLPGRVPLGYHQLQVSGRAGDFQTRLIAAPLRSYSRPGRFWGVFLPLYALLSQRSWGIGDFSDLQKLLAWVRAEGGQVVSTLPLMAAFLDPFCEISPYMPASRLFWNEVYVDPRQAPEFSLCAAASSLVRSRRFERELEALHNQPLADPRRAMALKRPVLEAMGRWLAQSRSRRAVEFRRYVAAHPRLVEYARFRAATERQNAPWTAWPARLRQGHLRPGDYDPAAEQYHQYAQWLAEQQIEALSEAAKDTGLYLDFPLGVHPAGFDVWSQQELFAQNIATGAPPDSLFSKGQNWAFPPPRPEQMRGDGYAYHIACLRQQFRHTRWLRIDHVMGLHRLFWIPEGFEARQGVYVRYPAEELHAILSLESHRARSIVVGENLGTVPPEVTRAMNRHGLHRMYVLQYEARPAARQCLRPVSPNMVASLNTHDMPPFESFWDGIDLREMAALGLLSRAEAAGQIQRRRNIRRALEQFLRAAAGKRVSPADSGLMFRCQQWLARSPAKMLLVNLEDLWGETIPQNVPGTSRERPNWRRRARYCLEEFTARQDIAAALRSLSQIRTGKALPKK